MPVNRTVQLTPVSPPGPGLTFALWGDATYAEASGGSSSGWQTIDRPRQAAALYWYDRALWSLSLPLALDSTTLVGSPGHSIELQCIILESWKAAVPGTTQPPVLNITGPVPGVQRQWVVYTVNFGNAIRDPKAGFRTQQQLTLMLYEYISPTALVLNNPTPAAAAAAALAAATASQSYLLYTVKGGDTLSTIAAKFLKNHALWTTLSKLNNIRDPNNLTPGQVIEIPQSP